MHYTLLRITVLVYVATKLSYTVAMYQLHRKHVRILVYIGISEHIT